MSSSFNSHPPASDPIDADVNMTSADADDEIEMLKRSVAQLEAETANLIGGAAGSTLASDPGASSLSHASVASAPPTVHSPVVIPPEKEESDRRSVHVSQVEYATTSEQLKAHFDSCGQIVRLTIMLDKHTAQPKGFAYIEFATMEGAQAALALNDSTLNGRQIKVTPKRTNVPGLKANRGGAGRGRGRGAMRGGAMPGMHYPPMMVPYGYPYPPPGAYGYPPMGPPPGAYPGYGYPPPPPPPHHGGGYQAGGAYRRGGGYQQGGRGGRYNPYGGGRGGYQRGGHRGGRGGYNRGGHGHGHGDRDRDDMFMPNDNQHLPPPGQGQAHDGFDGEHQHHEQEYQHHEHHQGEGGAEYPAEEPAGRW